MKIAIRKESNGTIYIDKEICSRTKEIFVDNIKTIVPVIDSETLTKPPYNYTIITVDYKDCQPNDFNDDLTFDIDKYTKRKQQERQVEYESLIVSEIRKKYTIDQELAILRQRDTKPEEFAEYNSYVEGCKLKVKEDLLLKTTDEVNN